MLNGVINVYKEKAILRMTLLAIVRKTLNIKVGHTGTLDPDAEESFAGMHRASYETGGLYYGGKKSYTAEITFGAETQQRRTLREILLKNTSIHLMEKST